MKIHISQQRNFMLRWINMIDRCDNPENKSFHRYGGRGISVCNQWYDFYRYIDDLPEGYFERAELDRIDNDGNYEPGNVRWATKRNNVLNRNNTRFIEFNGVKKCVSHWAKDLNLNVSSLMERLDNWSLEDALTQPKGTRLHNRWDGHVKPEPKPKKQLRLYCYNDKRYTMRELSALSGIPSKLLRKRINERKWEVERAVETKV